MPLTRDQRRSIADGKWWQSLLPAGWKLYGWTYRTSASAFSPDNRRVVQLDPELMLALHSDENQSGSIPMTPTRFADALDALGWSLRHLALLLACDEKLARRWANGAAEIPQPVADWLERLTTAHARYPAPTNWRRRSPSHTERGS